MKRAAPRWNITVGADVISPKVDAFVADIEATCEAHGLALSHEKGPGLIVAPFEEALLARLRNVRPATSATLKVIAEIEAACRNHRLVLTHEADNPWDLVRKEPAGRFLLTTWSEKRAADLHDAMIWDNR